MRKFARATSVNDNGHRYFEVTDELVDNIRTQHLLGIEDCIVDAAILEKTQLPIPHMLVTASTSFLQLDSGPINFLYFQKNGELIARFRR
ncbi:hypothetical protein [Pectobacterium phage Nepra]|uniref:Uncharacterized protein n=2 Tax=Cbunavirus TaxID=2842586 RepID=A0A2P0PAL7_9CAUD|nr:hypothetical protein HWB08_gp14 [Pectobacterium phage vB_PatP_CB1]YP_009837942.1 hypothetical protein HWB59_gp21 [Pectobacterium phage Nepra]ARB11741.1 hypothetical protein CB1_14 [Pectobacterium phage vB_PatP_CB1]AWD92605.1 hypothetical protein [Pectobacterium phage Nepra]